MFRAMKLYAVVENISCPSCLIETYFSKTKIMSLIKMRSASYSLILLDCTRRLHTYVDIYPTMHKLISESVENVLLIKMHGCPLVSPHVMVRAERPFFPSHFSMLITASLEICINDGSHSILLAFSGRSTRIQSVGHRNQRPRSIPDSCSPASSHSLYRT